VAVSRLDVARPVLVISLLLLAGWPVLEWWQFGLPTGLLSLWHTTAAVSLGYVFSLSRSLRREGRAATERRIAVVGGKEVQLLRLSSSQDEFAEGLFYAGIRIGAEEAATRAEELGASKLAEQLREEVRAAMPETDERLRSWRAMREREMGGAA